jgi:hypothetical protein
VSLRIVERAELVLRRLYGPGRPPNVWEVNELAEAFVRFEEDHLASLAAKARADGRQEAEKSFEALVRRAKGQAERVLQGPFRISQDADMQRRVHYSLDGVSELCLWIEREMRALKTEAETPAPPASKL